MLQKTERGQALILIALAAIGLFAFAALAVDGTRNFSNKRHAQNAADTSVLAAALKYVRTGDMSAAETAARERATSNGYTHDTNTIGPNTKVYIHLCNNTGSLGACEGIVSGHESEYIRVRIVDTIPTTFGRVIGRQTLTTAAEAIARIQGSSSSSTGSVYDGAAMVATKAGDSADCLLLNGGADIYIHNSGVFINCSGPLAIRMNDNIVFDMDAMGQVVGCYNDDNVDKNKPIPYDPITCGINGGTSYAEALYKAKYALVPKSPAPPSCSGPGNLVSASADADYIFNKGSTSSDITVKKGTVRISGGNYSSVVVNSGELIMNAGVYCLSGGMNINSSGTKVTGTGKVQLVMGNNALESGNGQTFKFEDLEVYSTNGGISVKGILNATSRFRFYSTGTGGIIADSHATIKSPDAYIYLAKGDPKWNSDSIIDLTAPKTVDSWGDVRGLLLHMPWDNPTIQVNLNGGSTVNVHGTFLMPHVDVHFNGGVDFKLYSQIIAYEFTVNGSGTVDIYYLANENYYPPNVVTPTIELTK